MDNREEFLSEIVSCIKFKFDRDEIKSEINNHIEDKIEFLQESKYSYRESENIALNEMGDPKEIGKLLNKEHNYIIGCIWKISIIIKKILIVLIIFFIIRGLVCNISVYFEDNDIKKDDIVYSINVNEKVQIDSEVIVFDEIIYTKDEGLYILYKSYDMKYFGSGWSIGSIGTITDELGNEYFEGGGGFLGGFFISKGMRNLKNFPENAKMIIIEYDYIDRYYKVEIPLEGVKYE